jgi:hypothetical protein
LLECERVYLSPRKSGRNNQKRSDFQLGHKSMLTCGACCASVSSD